jgi:SAM-dependent methyltransferase
MAMAEAFLSRCAAARCRSCGETGLDPVLDLGAMPHSDGLLAREQLGREARYPLEVAFCRRCTLVQILETVAPEILFGADYPYFSSFSDSWVEHARKCAEELIARKSLSSRSLVVELASNDGYLLRHFAARGVPVLGIDPAPGPAEAARRAGVPTLTEFFGLASARRLRGEGKVADVIVANNVLAHVADTNGFVAGIRTLLADDGLVSVEFPYVKDLIERRAFDTIYHEHLCYFSVRAARELFARHGLSLNDLRFLPTHGGSLRLYLGPGSTPTPAVAAALDAEARAGLHAHGYYLGFAAAVEELGRQVRALLVRLRGEGKRIAAYGAAAKGTIMLNYARVGTDLVDYVVDRNVHKQGKFLPGVHLPILVPSRLAEDPPDYLLILPWNLVDEIVAQQEAFRARGGKFIVPVPSPRIL